MDKKGFAKGLSVGALIGGIILLVIGFNVVADGVTEVQTAGDEINATGAPFASFFASDGIMILAFMGSVLLATLGVMGLRRT